jgi:hypothetical protein
LNYSSKLSGRCAKTPQDTLGPTRF